MSDQSNEPGVYPAGYAQRIGHCVNRSHTVSRHFKDSTCHDWTPDTIPLYGSDVVITETPEETVPMKTFLVAVVAPSDMQVQHFLAASVHNPAGAQINSIEADVDIDCWWIADDERTDGSDNDSAIFVPRGAQKDMYELLDQHFEHMTEEWEEHGYPYEATDVSGVWFRGDTRTDEQVIRDAARRWLLSEDFLTGGGDYDQFQKELRKVAAALGFDVHSVEAIHKKDGEF